MRIPVLNRFAYKMTLMALVTSTIAALILMGTFLVLDSRSSRAQLRARITTLADIVGENSTAALDFEDRTAAQQVLQALRAEPSLETACLYDRAGDIFAQYHRHKSTSLCVEHAQKLSNSMQSFSKVTRRVQRGGEFTGSVYLESDLQDFENRWRHLLLVTGIVLVIALFAGGISGSLLQRRIGKPIRDLATAMQEVTENHHFSTRVDVTGNDEVGHLGAGFNMMLCELEKRDLAKGFVEMQLQHQAMNDELMGLPNRRLLADRLSQALAAAERTHSKVALLYIDLDGFKLVNDSLGHIAGDILLQQVAGRLRQRIRQSDTLSRFGGDEFSAVLCGLDASEQAGHVSDSLLESMGTSFRINDHDITIGISIFPDNGMTTNDLLQQADSAMYAAKRAGKNRMAYFTEELGASARERLNLESQLCAAIAHGEIVVHYQPEFAMPSGRLVRFEALARWIHPLLGTVSPSKFIPIAEESGFIVPLGAFIMERACAEAVRWQAVASWPVQVAVNVSSIQFARESFVQEVEEVLRFTGLRPELLQIELTESVMLTGASRVSQTMRRLRDLGVSLAIDDFGTGYSCLGYLPQLPFDALKIDRSFVKDITSRPEVRAMVHSLVTLAHNFGMRVIAEGIETQEQLEFLSALGSIEIQGYLLGKPTPDPMSSLQRCIPEAVPVEVPGIQAQPSSEFA